MHATITTAKSSEVNILVPGASKDDDMVRFCKHGICHPIIAAKIKFLTTWSVNVCTWVTICTFKESLDATFNVG